MRIDGNNNQPKCVDAEGKCKIAREGVSKSVIYLKKWSLSPEIIKGIGVCLVGVMDNEVQGNRGFYQKFDADFDEFNVDEEK